MLLWTIANFIRLTVDSGQQLRQDDPLTLKNIIEIIQGNVFIKVSTFRVSHLYQSTSSSISTTSSRTRFIMELLQAISQKEMSHNISKEDEEVPFGS